MRPLTHKATGRFAPTPSGPLHFGSLVTAVASYCHARSHHADWVVRIEDLDTPRVVKGCSDDILTTLEVFGFEWDGEVLFQSQRIAAYRDALKQLKDKGLVYTCQCSRKQLRREPHRIGPLGLIYPGHCRKLRLPESDASLRLDLQQAGIIRFDDLHFQTISVDLTNDVGDIVLLRRDHIFAYHLAVIADDAFQSITQIVRGADLLQSTAIHLYMNRLLGFQNAQYLHLPLVKNAQGDKLSKQTGARALDIDNAPLQLLAALKFLGQNTAQDLSHASAKEILQHAIAHWDINRIPPNR